MKLVIPLVIAGVFYSMLCAFYLYDYYRLLQSGRRTVGIVVSFDQVSTLFFRSFIVPVVRFDDETNSSIEKSPQYSVFNQLYSLQRHSPVTIYYQKDKPDFFIIDNRIEPVMSWLVIAATLGAILYLFTQ